VYRVKYAKDAEKYLKAIPLKHAKHVHEKITECLMVNPKGKTSHCNIKAI